MRRECWGEHVSEQGCVVSAGVNMWNSTFELTPSLVSACTQSNQLQHC